MPPEITANMRIRDILARHPQAASVFNRYGIRCEGCHAARYESLGQGARVHGIDLAPLLADLNAAASAPSNRARDRLPILGN